MEHYLGLEQQRELAQQQIKAKNNESLPSNLQCLLPRFVKMLHVCFYAIHDLLQFGCFIFIFILSTAEFVDYIEYCRRLEYDDEPDYNYLRSLLQKAFDNAHFVWDFEFDWIMLKAVCP